jgi:hypothetical protein
MADVERTIKPKPDASYGNYTIMPAVPLEKSHLTHGG